MRALVIPLVLMLALSGCQPLPSGPAPGTSIAVHQLAGGPGTGAVRVFAATSLAELQAMVWASGSTPSFDECAGDAGLTPGFRDSCWWTAGTPSGVLLVATPLAEPQCPLTRGVSAALTGASTLQITIDHGGSCSPGPEHQVSAVLSLLAMQVQDLPPLLLQVRVSHSGRPGAASATEVDLRRPVDDYGDPVPLAQEIRQAYVRSAEDAFNRYGAVFRPAGIAIRRWTDAGVGCPVKGRPYRQTPVHGYVVRMRMATDPRALTVEYHGRPEALAFCGSRAPASPPPS